MTPEVPKSGGRMYKHVPSSAATVIPTRVNIVRRSLRLLSNAMLISFAIGAMAEAQEWSTPQMIVGGLYHNGPDYGLSVAVDSSGGWHMVYLGGPGGYPTVLHIMYASNTSGPVPLATGIFDSAGVILGEPSIAIDPEGGLHVVYRYHIVVYGLPTPSAIMYINNTAGFWSSPQEIVTGLDAPSDHGLSVAADSTQDWHVVYLTHTIGGAGLWTDRIMYVSGSSGPVTLATKTYHDSTGTGAYLWDPSIAIDLEGGLHVVYRLDERVAYVTTSASILYMNSASGSWSAPQEIANGLSLYYEDMDLSITVDSPSDWHVVYPDGTAGNYIQYVSSASNPVTIASGAHLWEPSIDMDLLGGLHVMFRDYTNMAIMYTQRQVFCVCTGNRGDLNGDGVDANILDLTFLVDRIFRGGPSAVCDEEADLNSDGTPSNILDLTFLVDFIFRGGTAPGPCP